MHWNLRIMLGPASATLLVRTIEQSITQAGYTWIGLSQWKESGHTRSMAISEMWSSAWVPPQPANSTKAP